jgi:hypothetical protein
MVVSLNHLLQQTGHAKDVTNREGPAMRRRALLWLAGVALVVGGLLLTDALLWRPGLSVENVQRIRPGMSLAEVEALPGGSAAKTIDGRAEGEARDPLRVRWQRHWQAEGAAVVVQFWPDGRVMAAAGGRPAGRADNAARAGGGVRVSPPSSDPRPAPSSRPSRTPRCP